MYAIVEIAGKQYKLEKDLTVYVDRLKDKEGDITLDKVLLYSKDGDIKIGEPFLSNVTVSAKVVGEKKGKKVRGVKFKKRKNYTRTLGHRRVFSVLKINDLVVS